VELNWLRILAARQTTIAAAKAYQAEVRLFERGQRTSTDVLIAAGLIADAQLAEIDALAQYQNGKVDLAVATGTMLGYGRVAWGPPAGASGGKPAPPP
jgi:outer membrane protein TolC